MMLTVVCVFCYSLLDVAESRASALGWLAGWVGGCLGGGSGSGGGWGGGV